jgi:hypothetical protein
MAIGENSSLEIGQIIYVLSNKAQKIIPAIVVEEITVKTIEGNQSSWKVSVGPQGKEKTIDSKRLDGELYGSIEEVQGVLKDRLDGFINQIVSDAQKKVSSWYGTKTATLNASRNEDQNGKVDPESLIDEIDSPPEPIISAKRTAAKTRTSAEEARRKAVASIVGLEEQQSSPTDENSEFIELPGGQKVKVNIKTA